MFLAIFLTIFFVQRIIRRYELGKPIVLSTR